MSIPAVNMILKACRKKKAVQEFSSSALERRMLDWIVRIWPGHVSTVIKVPSVEKESPRWTPDVPSQSGSLKIAGSRLDLVIKLFMSSG